MLKIKDILIIGAGQASLHLALGLVNAKYNVTIVSDKKVGQVGKKDYSEATEILALSGSVMLVVQTHIDIIFSK